jgi:hypothetical protein
MYSKGKDFYKCFLKIKGLIIKNKIIRFDLKGQKDGERLEFLLLYQVRKLAASHSWPLGNLLLNKHTCI